VCGAVAVIVGTHSGGKQALGIAIARIVSPPAPIQFAARATGVNLGNYFFRMRRYV